MEFRVKRLNKELGENSKYEYVLIEDEEKCLYIASKEKVANDV